MMIWNNKIIAQTFGAFLFTPPDVIEQWLPMMAPFPLSFSEARYRTTIDQVLSNYCWNQEEGGGDDPIIMETLNDTIAEHTPHNNNNNHNQNTFRRAMTYGEITPLGARQLFKTLGMTKRRRKSHPSRTNSYHFLDLGSGNGKLVIQAYLELPLLRSAVGIELVPSRHKTALQAWDEIQQQEDVVKNLYHESITTTNRTIQFIQGDLFQDINLSKATHIYIASLLFSEDMMAQLEQKLATEAIHLECVATLKPFPLGLLQQHHQPKQMDPSENKNKNKPNSPRQPAVEYVEMSWTKPLGAQVYIYKMNE